MNRPTPLLREYPPTSPERDRWILDRRPQRNAIDPSRPHAFLLERERSASGDVVNVATVFLTNRECPWRCLMCDLWKNTLTDSVPAGAIPAQVDYALRRIEDQGSASTVRQIKLYNSGSFFDPRAIPVTDYPAVADRVRSFERVIVECHPALVGDRCLQFQELVHESSNGQAKLEVAMGLETAHPEALEKLNKRMTLDQFRRAAEFLRSHDISLRVFVLVQPPFLDEAEASRWTMRSIDFAFGCGAGVVSLIPTRAGNGALEALAAAGMFATPKLSAFEAALDYGVDLKRGRVFADLWDLEKFSDCPECFVARRARLNEINQRQDLLPRTSCSCSSG